jgi:hypothetical protein
LFAGPAVTLEQGADTGSQTAFELVFGTALDWFKFTHPELDLSTQLVLFPSMPEAGRVRAWFDTTLRWEIVNDLYWQLSVYDHYGTEAVNFCNGTRSSSYDYQIAASRGWSW